MTGAINTIKFFLSEAFLGQQFEAVDMEANKPEPGDLFLYKLLNPVGHWCGAHVGVYCGHGEIIHFEGEATGCPPVGGYTRIKIWGLRRAGWLDSPQVMRKHGNWMEEVRSHWAPLALFASAGDPYR